jgi:hypothetical protein
MAENNMAGNDRVNPMVEWRWDRFNVRTGTSTEWAARNCTGSDSNTQQAQLAMQHQIQQELKHIEVVVTAEIHELLWTAADITGMTYKCKFTQYELACIKTKDMRVSWVQNGGADNQKRLAWMFYYYGSELYKTGVAITHGDWVEQKVMKKFNISYVHLNALTKKESTCVQQLYSKKMNAIRSNLMRHGPTFTHTSQIKIEQPKVDGSFRKNYKRDKTTFFSTFHVTNKAGWNKVSITGKEKPVWALANGADIWNVAYDCTYRWIIEWMQNGWHGIRLHYNVCGE